MNLELAAAAAPQSREWSAMPSTLSNVALFANVEPEAIEGLLEACPRRELAEGEVLIRPGEVNQTLYLILSGRLRVHLDSLDNPPLAVLESGENVGELSVIDHKPASAWVVADSVTTLLAVDPGVSGRWCTPRTRWRATCSASSPSACVTATPPSAPASGCSRSTSATPPPTISPASITAAGCRISCAAT